MWLIRAIIRIPIQFISGIIADRFNRKLISVIVYIFSSILSILFIFTTDKSIGFAFILIFLLQGTSDVDNTAQMTMLPEIVDKKDLEGANSIFNIIGTVIMLTAPGIGGLLYINYGTNVLFVIDSITFLVAAIIFSRVKYTYHKNDNKEQNKFMLFKFAKEGLLKLKEDRSILVLISVMMVYAVLGRLYEIDKVYVADKIIGIGAEGIVFFSYAMAVGSLIAPFFIKFIKHKNINRYNAFLVISICASISFMIWGNAKLIFLSYFANFLMGFFDSNMNILFNSILQETIDNKYLGRVMSFYKIGIVSSAVIGILLAPLLLRLVGVGISITIVGLISIILILILRSIKKSNIQEKKLEFGETN